MFHEATACGQLDAHFEVGDRRGVVLKHDFLVTQLGSGRSGLGENSEGETDEADRKGGGGTGSKTRWVQLRCLSAGENERALQLYPK